MMVRGRMLLVLAVPALMALPGAASAATVGSIDTAGALSCGGFELGVVQQSVSSGPSYTIPSQSVITGWRTVNGAASTSGVLLVARSGAGSATIVGSTPVSLAPTLDHITRVDGVRIPAQAGDVLGVEVLSGAGGWPCSRGAPDSSDQIAHGTPTGTAAGATFPLASLQHMTRLNVEATIEPDADGDGYGDVTQDLCPLASLHSALCPPDLVLTQSVDDPTIAVGDLAAFDLTIHDAAAGPAPAATMTDALPAGFKLVSASTSSGTCTAGPPATCTLGPIPTGHDVTILLLATAQRAGVWNNTARVAPTGADDPNPANNTASQTVTVTAATSGGAGALSVKQLTKTKKAKVKVCVVPKLRGLKISAVKKKLKKANCKLGKRRGKGKHVAKQSLKAGKHKKRGTKVSIRMKK